MDQEASELVKVKTPEQIKMAIPIKPKGYWWKSYLSVTILMGVLSMPFMFMAISLLISSNYGLMIVLLWITLIIDFMAPFFLIDNIGPTFIDKKFGLHYYKKRQVIWNKWWHETWKYKQYLNYKKQYDS